MHYIKGNSFPYFSITEELYRGHISDEELVVKNYTLEDRYTASYEGSLRDVINRELPEFGELYQWQLCAANGTPLYYFENSMYWYGKKEFDKFENTAVIELEERVDYQSLETVEQVQQWLEKRLPKVKGRFFNTMEKFGVTPLLK